MHHQHVSESRCGLAASGGIESRTGGIVESRRVCPYCGAWIEMRQATCPLCRRSVGTVAAAGVSAVDGRESRWAPERVSVREVMGELWGVRGVIYLSTGLAFVIGYPWLLAAFEAAAPGSAVQDLWLAAAWLAPEVYLLMGLVWAAHLANANRRAALGIVPTSMALLLQLIVLPAAVAWTPAAAYAVTLFGLQGATLMWGAPLLLFALGSVGISLVAAWTPRVVPGKFARVIGPQLGCLSVLVVALLLPTWGGLAWMRFSLDLGFPTIWVDVVAVFVFTFFTLFWFRPGD